MGGKAFSQATAERRPTLETPRMSPATYTAIKLQYTKALQEYFAGCQVAVPKEAPGKLDYGDIDFIVGTHRNLDLLELANFVGAAGIIGGGARRCSLAVPQDGSTSKVRAAHYKATGGPQSKGNPSDHVAEEDYAQLDIELVRPAIFKWHTFYSSYGDMSGLLGAITHNLGFTTTDIGFHLRLKELDDAKQIAGVRVADTQGLLFLSDEPADVMRFLGLSPKAYQAGFETLHQFYAFLAASHFVTPDIHQMSKRKSNSRNRQKERKRTIINNFFDDFLPTHRNIAPDSSSADPLAEQEEEPWPPPRLVQRRQQHAQDAVDFFGRREVYTAMHADLVGWIASQRAEILIKPIIASHSGRKDKKLAEVVKAFRRWVTFDSHLAPQIAHAAHQDHESELRFWLSDGSESLRDEAAVSAWVKGHWEKLKELERRGP